MPVRVSQSSIKAWRRCKKAYDYKYVENLRPRSIQRPLKFGSAVHKAIEFIAHGKTVEAAIEEMNKDRAQVFASELDFWDEIMRDATWISRAYQRHYKKSQLEPVKIGKKKSEHKFEIPIARDIVLTGVVDEFADTADGRRWLVEHKTRGGRIENDDVRTRDLQTLLYTSPPVLDFFGIKKVSGVFWDYIRSKSPSIPQQLKDGSLSKRAIDTLPEVYSSEIKRLKLDPKDYLDILGNLDDNVPNWFRRVPLPLAKTATSEILEETIYTAKEIRRKAGVDTTRNFTRDCSWCPYEKLCIAELRGADAAFIRQREYRVSERSSQEEVTEDRDPD